MKISKLVAVIALSIVINCCNAQAESAAVQTEYSQGITERINYIQDARTGICFAVFNDCRHSALSTSAVPCEEIPEQLLNKGR